MVTKTDAPLAYITGASSGLGRALALAYARQGWRLALVGRQPHRIQQWLKDAAIADEQVRIYQADAEQTDSLLAAGDACLRDCGPPQVVIACAGISIGMDTQDRGDLDVMRETLSVNVLGVAATFQPFIAAMKELGQGRLVGIASVAAMRGLPGHGAYCASKSAVVAYCESLRLELRGSGVRVVTLLPGFIDTPMTRGNPYPMPFLMPADRFADSAVRAIRKGVAWRVIPWQMGVVAWLLRWLPNAWFDKLFADRPRKPRRQSN